ncbi:MAG: pacearchaeosortase [Candidatus Nanoarchaeia archaeon]|jgi:hypothetical protein|nr:pacearchaeosortase [Candidatus Nanoarchaeia archaeon]MDD3993715.1 pacearchaeosortase [Candidatus Nanoarchaeia archaeon]
MKKKEKDFYFIFLRYIIILLFGIGNLFVFYFILTPVTTYSVYGILSLYHEVELGKSGILFLESFNVGLIDSCIAGGAFYLLFILIMSTGNLNLKRRLTILFYSFLIFLFLNVLRILVLIELYGTNIFIFAHWFLWNVMSTLFVVGIWFFMVKIYKIKSYPFLTDFYNFLNFVRYNNNLEKKSLKKVKNIVRKK